MTDLLLRWLSKSRAGGQDDYDVIGADGLVIRPHADARLRADARRPCRHRQELAPRDVRPSGNVSGSGDEPRAVAQTTHAGPRWRGRVAASTSFWPSTYRSSAVQLSFYRHSFGQCLRATYF